MKKLTALILCGGNSTRMGSDKGLLPLNDQTWAESLVSLCLDLDLPASVSIHRKQYDEYRKIFAPEQLVIDDFFTVDGPLEGIMTFHRFNQDKDLLVIPCDMIFLSREILSQLLKEYYSSEKADFTGFKNNGKITPFPGIFSAETLSETFTKYIAGIIKSWSLKSLINKFEKCSFLEYPGKKPFSNINYMKERDKLTA